MSIIISKLKNYEECGHWSGYKGKLIGYYEKTFVVIFLVPNNIINEALIRLLEKIKATLESNQILVEINKYLIKLK